MRQLPRFGAVGAAQWLGRRRFEQLIENLWGMAAAGHTDARGAPRPLLRLAVFAKEFERKIQLVSPPRWLQRLLFSVLAADRPGAWLPGDRSSLRRADTTHPAG